jgi:hypothetical protein
MRRALAALTIASLHLAVLAQQAPPHVEHASASTAAERKVELPVTRVSLYKNGVGFFEHTGTVTGNAAVTIDFTSAQLNDVLQSLTAIDLNGGRISGAGYNSTTPLDQQLKSLSLGLGEKTTFSGLFTALHGTRVAVSGSGAPFTGRIVDIEMHKTGAGEDSAGMVEGRFLTVASDSGEIRIFQVTPTLSVRLLDTATHTELNRYLELLDSTRNQGLRHLTLDDHGTGARQLQVSYISEVPIWKSTYRILFTEQAKSVAAQTATLQGWSVVDNTTGTDWINVHLSLIAGAPQSFIQPLSQPIYSRRPEIPIAQEAQLTPQTFESGMDANDAAAKVPPAPASVTEARAGRLTSQSRNFMSMSAAETVNVNGAVGGLAPAPSYQEYAAASIAPNTTTAAFEDFFAYKIADPVTIRTNESALVPILQAKVDVERVTLVSSDGSNVSQPLRALWLTNTTGLTLDRGSFSIVENGNFGGEGLLDPIHPDEKRLLSYAADQAIRVSAGNPNNGGHVTRITASKGVVIVHRAETTDVTYSIHNSASDARTVILEHPVRPGYELTSDTKPTETTPTVYRFRVEAAPGATVSLQVAAKHRAIDTFQLTNSDDNQLAYILNVSGNDPELQAGLAPVLDARRRVADAQAAVTQANNTLNNLRKDEDRQRANITALQSADKSSRDRFVRDLNHTEDQITAAQGDLAARTAALDAAKADLANRIDNLNLDVKVEQK